MSISDRVKATSLAWLLSGINVLVVMDGRVGSGHYASFGAGDLNNSPSSGDAYFGLSEFIETLTDAQLAFAHFNVTKAHRDTDVRGMADIEHFRFDQHDLSVYDEIFLFGVADPGGTDAPMTDSELAALTTFMNGGGGVFATGDHEDLGVVLNGRVPRVRSMRKWYYPQPGPNGEPAAPTALGTQRIDTTQRGAGESFTHFDDQSDDIPQPITPRWYTNTAFFVRFQHPHPLLCGPRGAIKVLPDHMHEGEVIAPWDAKASFTFAGQTFVEFPTDAAGNQELPEIVGWGRVVAETNTSTEPAHVGDPGNQAIARSFGVVGAYDGHRVGVGRVAVDSTWHHFFDINLIGDPVAPYPKTLGFKASPAGLEALANIKAYFINIATWLARPGKFGLLFAGAAWMATRTQPLNMIVRAGRDYSHDDLMRIGALAWQNIVRFTPPCTVISVLWKYWVEGPVRIFPPDPWARLNRGDPPFVDPVTLVQAALGGAVIALTGQRGDLHQIDPHEAVNIIEKAVRAGVQRGFRGLGADMARYGKGLQKLGEEWSSLG